MTKTQPAGATPRKSGYIPLPRTIPARVVEYLHEQLAKGRQWVPGTELAEHIGQPVVGPYLVAPIRYGCLIRRAA